MSKIIYIYLRNKLSANLELYNIICREPRVVVNGNIAYKIMNPIGYIETESKSILFWGNVIAIQIVEFNL